MLFLSFSSDEKSFYTVLLPHAPCTLANCYRMQVYIYRLIQYTYIQDDTYTHRYASTSILHIGWYSYTLIHILAFKIHFVFAFFADYTLIHIFKPIHTHYTLRYASTSIYLYADTVSHWYIYLALKIHLVFAFFAVYSGIDSYTLIHIFKPIHTH
jgi:hypothetical protein